MNQRITRRGLLRLGLGAAAGAAGARLIFGGRAGLSPVASAQTSITPKYYLAGTDGWASLPGQANSPYYPDAWAPAGKTTYMFGFADVSQYAAASQAVPAGVLAYKERAQTCAPIMYFDEGVLATVRLTNLGLARRPDLVDSHTVHWHGFRNVIPMFDGEPSSSMAVPIGRVFDYAYIPYQPGTYMYHCHFEDTEHVHMGMVGPVVVRPAQNGDAGLYASGKYAYNDGDGSTGYDREYLVFLSEVWSESHWDDAHIQLPDWTDYEADFYLMNGRAYPDTLLPHNAPVGAPANGVSGNLDSQPYSSLIRCNAGERVLLRFINLGFTKASMSLGGLRLRVVGMDAVMLRGRTGADSSFETSTIQIGPGESVDAIFEAPAVASASAYLLYNRNIPGISNNGNLGLGGQATEVQVYPAGTLGAQVGPNDIASLG